MTDTYNVLAIIFVLLFVTCAANSPKLLDMTYTKTFNIMFSLGLVGYMFNTTINTRRYVKPSNYVLLSISIHWFMINLNIYSRIDSKFNTSTMRHADDIGFIGLLVMVGLLSYNK